MFYANDVKIDGTWHKAGDEIVHSPAKPVNTVEPVKSIENILNEQPKRAGRPKKVEE